MINKEVLCKLGLSKIHGIGVFAIRDIEKGSNLLHFTDSLIPLEGMDEKTLSVVLNRNVIYKDTVLVEHPNSEINYTAFMNHSDTPNSDGVFALQDIKEGDEITEDYRNDLMSETSKKYFTFL
jgi:SET domain-containing protein